MLRSSGVNVTIVQPWMGYLQSSNLLASMGGAFTQFQSEKTPNVFTQYVDLLVLVFEMLSSHMVHNCLSSLYQRGFVAHLC